MKANSLRFLPSYLINLCAMAAVSCAVSWLYGLFPNPEGKAWMIGIFAAVCFCVLAIVSHCLAKGKKLGYLLSYTFNAIGSGCCVGTVFADHAMEPLVQMLLLALLPGVVLGTLLCLGCAGPNERFSKICSVCVLVLAVIQFVGGICLWICWEPVVGCFALFSALYLMPLPIACICAADHPEKTYRYQSFSGFVAFFMILLVALLILSEGDIFDGLDLDFGGGDSKKKKKMK